MSELLPAAGSGLEIEFIVEVPGRAAKGAKQTMSSSMARDYVDKGVARYTGVGLHWQYRERLANK